MLALEYFNKFDKVIRVITCVSCGTFLEFRPKPLLDPSFNVQKVFKLFVSRSSLRTNIISC